MRWLKSMAIVSGIVLILGLRPSVAEPTTVARPPGTSSAGEAPRILVVGDSLSAEYGLPRGTGWVHYVERRLQERGQAYQIRNASISGDTTQNGLQRLPALLQSFNPNIVVLQLGANDGLRGLPIPDMEANLRKMIELCKNAQARVLLVGQHVPPNYGRRYADQFHAVYAKLASTHRIGLVPFMLEEIALDQSMFQSDGLHPTEAAQPKIAETIWPPLAALLD